MASHLSVNALPKSTRQVLYFGLPVIFILTVLGSSMIPRLGEQFSQLALSYIHGKTYFLSPLTRPGLDPVLYHGRVYWDDGPLPSIILLPFVALFSLFHEFFYQSYLQWALVILVIYAVYKLARLFKFSQEDSYVFAIAFSLGSVFIGVASFSSSWFLAQVITTLLLFAALYEFFTKRRWWLLGVCCACITMTRPTAALPLGLFFVLELAFASLTARQKMVRLVSLGVPVAISVFILGLYNYIRFGSFLNEGNAYQVVSAVATQSRTYGVFSPIHLPNNLYNMFLGAPQVVAQSAGSWILKFPYITFNPQGMSIFLTSPYFLYLFTVRRSLFSPTVKRLAVSVLVGILFVGSYYGVGAQELGSRYTLDFLPELFVLFMLVYKADKGHLTFGMKSLILGSSIFNFCLLLTFF